MPDAIFPAHETYAKGLWPLGHGHALWCPEPSLLFGQVRLGDVGYLRDGHFLFMFNVMRDAADPVNQRGVPDDFEPFVPPNTGSEQHYPDQITQKELHSRGMRSIAVSAGMSASEAGASATASFRYQCTTTSGALLYLRDHGHKTFLDCDRHIKKYMSTHVTSWYQFATRHLGIDVEEQDLILISGFTKTSIWAEVAFHNSQSNGELVVSGGCLAPLISGELRVSTSQCVDAAVSSRIGPAYRITGSDSISMGPDQYDQCIFLNYHKAKRRKLWRPRIMRAAAGPHDLPSTDSDNDSGTSSLVSSLASEESSGLLRYNSFDPVGQLLEYMLKRSEASVVCASDHDLITLLPEQTIPDDIACLLASLTPPVEVDNQGLGIVDIASLDHQARPRTIAVEPGALGESLDDVSMFDEDEFSHLVHSPSYDDGTSWMSNPLQADTSAPQSFDFSTFLPWSSHAPSPSPSSSPGRQPFMRSWSYSPQLSDSDSINEYDPDATVREKRSADTVGVNGRENVSNKHPHTSLRSSPKHAPSAWQLFFSDWMRRREASDQEKLNTKQAAHEAGREYAQLSAAEKEPYRLRSRALKEASEHQSVPKITPEDIKRESSYRAEQRAARKSRARGRQDPNVPKKPLSAYFKFLQFIRSDPALTKELFGDETETTKQSVLAAGKWRAMTDDERKPFLAEAEKEKLEYGVARKLYEEGTSGQLENNVNLSACPAPMSQIRTRPRPHGKERATENEAEWV